MSKNLFRVIIFLCLSFAFNQSYAQCSSISNTSTSATAANCPSNGTITVHSSADSLATTTYQIISGPASGGFQTTSQSSDTFTGLPAGTYTIQITCGSVTADVTTTVTNNYTPLSLSASLSNICNNSTPGGTITVATTGGNPALSYGFLLSDSSSAADSSFAYSANNIYSADSFGIYQVRVKDACNNFVTQPVQITPLSPSGELTFTANGSTCTSNSFQGSLTTTSGVSISSISGYQYQVYQVPAGADCSVPAGATPIITKTIIQASDLQISLPVSVQQAVVVTTSPCGQQTTQCLTIPQRQINISEASILPCNGDTTPASLNILFWAAGNFTWPLTVTITPQGGSSITATAADNPQLDTIFYNTPYASQYSYTITDACGNDTTGTIYTPQPSWGLQIYQGPGYTNCVNTVGAKDVDLYVRGYNPGADKFIASIVNSAGDTVYTSGISADGYIFTSPLTPGNYTIVFKPIDSDCPPSNFPLTVTNDNILQFSLSDSVTQLCGGTGTITGLLTYSGFNGITTTVYQPVTFDLLDSSGTVITSNISGVFPNLPAGAYTIRVTADYSSCGEANLVATQQAIIQPAGVGPQIIKKIGVNCDSDPSTAIASFVISGSGPFLLEMKKTTDSTFTTITNNAPTNYTVTGLASNTSYDVRLTDNCGNTSVTQVSTQALKNIALDSAQQPCNFKPYTLSVQQIPGATYSWTYNGAGPIATSSSIAFANYTPVNNGTYVCTVTLGTCVTRTVTITLNSGECGMVLPVKLISFTAQEKSSDILLNWQTTNEINTVYFEIQRSTNDSSWLSIGKVATEGNSSNTNNYSFTDLNPINGVNYYRLKMMDNNGNYQYSDIRTISIADAKEITVLPNPVTDKLNIIASSGIQILNEKLLDNTGRLLYQNNGTERTIDVSQFAKGIYYLYLQKADGTQQVNKIIKLN